jgi:high-affinity iron transporter
VALFLRIILIRHKLFSTMLFAAVCLASPLAGQAGDSLSASRRVVAATALAAKEYATGVAPAGGRVTRPEEVDEAKQFVEQARFDVPLLPLAVRAFGDSALAALGALLDRAAAPAAVQQMADSLGRRIAAAAGGAIVPMPAQPPSLARGAQVFREQCTECHGLTGHGDGPKAARLKGPPPADLADAAVMGGVTPVDIYRKVMLGVAGTAMPSFEETLPDADRWAVTAYVATLPYGGSPTAAVFGAVRRQLDTAVATRSERQAFEAYLTFEQVETGVRARNPGLAAELESGFTQLRARIGAAPPGEVAARHARLLAGLERAERLVADRASAAGLLGTSFLLLLREGFEAILIVGALMAFLGRAGATERRREVAWGAWAAVGASAVTAVAFELLFHVTPGQRDAVEGFTMLLAAVVLFYVSYWLLSKVEADKWSQFLKGKMQTALSSGTGGGGGLALASVAFLAVYREGVETILFYQALLSSGEAGGGNGVPAVLGGIALGAVALVVLYLAINRWGMRVPMKPFFAVTGGLLYYMAFVFAGKGVAELQEGGYVGTTVVEWGPRLPFLGVYPTVQSLALQAVLLALAVFAVVWVAASGAFNRSIK